MIFAGLDALTVVLDPPGAHGFLAGGLYHLPNRVDHELGLLLVYVMAAVGVRDVPGSWHLAHEIGPGIHNSPEEQLAELLRFFGRHRQRAVLHVRHKVKRLVGGEHDEGHRLQGSGGQGLFEVSLLVEPLQVGV